MPYVLESIKIYQATEDILSEILVGLESWCIAFNELFIIFSKYLKYIFVFIILFIGILTLIRLRGVYRQSRLMGTNKEEDSLTKTRLILGCLYIFLGFGNDELQSAEYDQDIGSMAVIHKSKITIHN